MTLTLASLYRAVSQDPGLRAAIPDAQIDRGLSAAADLNRVLLRIINQTGVNADGLISPGDMQRISDALWRDGNAGTARSGHGPRRSTSRFGSFLPPSRRGGTARLGQADRGMSCGGRKRICDASASPSDRRSPVSADDCNPGGNFFLERV